MGLQELSSSEIGTFDHTSIGMTKHALARMQQRGVDHDLLHCLLAYGHHEPDHKGCNVVTFDGRAIADLGKYEPKGFKAKATGNQRARKPLSPLNEGQRVLPATGPAKAILVSTQK